MEKHENFFERLARERGITVEEMKQIISDRIEQGLHDPDPEKRKSWGLFPVKVMCPRQRNGYNML